MLAEQIEPSRLSFNSKDDAINYANKVVEEWNRGLVENNTPNVVEAYRRVQLEIVISAAPNPSEVTLKESAREAFDFVDVRLGMIDGEARTS